MTKLEELKELLQEMENIGTACVLLDWDLKTEAPKGAADVIVASLTALSTKHFELSISEKMETLVYALNEPEEFEQLDDVWKKSVEKMKKDFDENKRIPVEFYGRTGGIIPAPAEVLEQIKKLAGGAE